MKTFIAVFLVALSSIATAESCQSIYSKMVETKIISSARSGVMNRVMVGPMFYHLTIDQKANATRFVNCAIDPKSANKYTRLIDSRTGKQIGMFDGNKVELD